MREELMEAGLTKNESKVYLAILELGCESAGTIAKKSKVHRTNVYDALEGLMKKGLVSYINKDGAKHYQTNDFNNLLDMIKEKEEKIRSILPQIALLDNMSKSKTDAQILEGLPAAKRVMNNFLRHEEPILVVGVPSNVADLIGPFLSLFHKKRVEKSIEMKHIYNSDAHERIEVLNKIPNTPIRILPSEYDSPVATNIVGNEVTMIHWSKNALIIKIKNEKIAEVYKRYFELMWNKAKPYQPPSREADKEN